jgi:predicted ATP-grasp superfamily ATP-dependent carboligase
MQPAMNGPPGSPASHIGVQPPCVILHGDVNALSIARSLGRRRLRVFALNDADAPVCASRYVTPIDVPLRGRDREAVWTEYLLGPESDSIRGAVLLAASDLALRILAAHRGALAERFRLDLADPDAQRTMLDKRASLEVARRAGIDHPRFWTVGEEEIDAIVDELPYPVVVKPVDTARFVELTGRKLLVVDNRKELEQGIRSVTGTGLEFVIVELIPGPDDLLCSYYPYLDEDGAPQFHFTKRVIRRFPVLDGPAVYHVTDWIPEAAEAGLRVLQEAGVRGLGHVEFKRDERDGQLKFIESNVRFTAGNPLLVSAGLDLGSYVYDRVTSGVTEPFGPVRQGLHLWHPVLDAREMLELRTRGDITVAEWLRSVAHRQVLPWFSTDDPGPSFAKARSTWRTSRTTLARRRAADRGQS